MANIESKHLIPIVKSFARANGLPLEKDEIWESLSAAQQYMQSPTAYAGQTIKVLMDDGKYKQYIVQLDGYNLVLEEAVDSNALVQRVQVVETLPSTPSQGIVYILTTDDSGHIWNGLEYKQIFGEAKIDIAQYARLDGAVFTGDVLLAGNPNEQLSAVPKQYVDNIVSIDSPEMTKIIQKVKEEVQDTLLIMTEF